jgi:hypothetical protein
MGIVCHRLDHSGRMDDFADPRVSRIEKKAFQEIEKKHLKSNGAQNTFRHEDRTVS